MPQYLTQDEISMLIHCKNSSEWRRACDKIKDARGGCYPSDWWEKAVKSGLMKKACGTSELRVETFNGELPGSGYSKEFEEWLCKGSNEEAANRQSLEDWLAGR